jgi:hypothetical protein
VHQRIPKLLAVLVLAVSVVGAGAVLERMERSLTMTGHGTTSWLRPERGRSSARGVGSAPVSPRPPGDGRG